MAHHSHHDHSGQLYRKPGGHVAPILTGDCNMSYASQGYNGTLLRPACVLCVFPLSICRLVRLEGLVLPGSGKARSVIYVCYLAGYGR